MRKTTKISAWISKNKVAITLPADSMALPFLWYRDMECQSYIDMPENNF